MLILFLNVELVFFLLPLEVFPFVLYVGFAKSVVLSLALNVEKENSKSTIADTKGWTRHARQK